MSVNVGDVQVKVTATTEELEQSIDELLERMQRTVDAARRVWNEKRAELTKMKCLCIVGCTVNGACPIHGDAKEGA